MWLGFFFPEKDGLITESQALHQTFAARAGKKTTIRPDRPMAFC
jgi:hypothetical protein